MKKTILTYGAIAGIITGGLMLVTMPLFENGTLTMDNGALIGYAGMVISLSLIFVGIKSHRDRHADGQITFGRGVALGLGITVVASLFYAAAWEITYARAGHRLVQQWQDGELRKLEAAGASVEKIAQTKVKWAEFAEWYKNPFLRFGVTLTEILPVGLLITLVSAALLRKKEFLPSQPS